MNFSRIALAVLASMIVCTTSAAAPIERHAAGGATAYSHAPRVANFASKGGVALIIVVDPGDTTSHQLLDMLRANGFDGRRMQIIVLSDAASAPMYVRDHRAMLPSAQWTLAPATTVRKDVALPGTPVVLGIDVDRRVIWQEEGVPARKGDLIVRVADWLKVAAK